MTNRFEQPPMPTPEPEENSENESLEAETPVTKENLGRPDDNYKKEADAIISKIFSEPSNKEPEKKETRPSEPYIQRAMEKRKIEQAEAEKQKEQKRRSLSDLMKGAEKLHEKEEAAKRGELLAEDLVYLQESGFNKEGKIDTDKISEQVSAANRIMKALEARGHQRDSLPRYDFDKLYKIATAEIEKSKTESNEPPEIILEEVSETKADDDIIEAELVDENQPNQKIQTAKPAENQPVKKPWRDTSNEDMQAFLRGEISKEEFLKRGLIKMWQSLTRLLNCRQRLQSGNSINLISRS